MNNFLKSAQSPPSISHAANTIVFIPQPSARAPFAGYKRKHGEFTAAMVDRSSTTGQETSSRFGELGAHTEGHAGAPAVPSPAAPAVPPPIVAVPTLPAAIAFSSPLLQDGEQLWACADAAGGEADPLACFGEQSAQAYCQQRDAQSGPELRIADAQPGIPVRAVNGDVCQNAGACRVVSELQCDH